MAAAAVRRAQRRAIGTSRRAGDRALRSARAASDDRATRGSALPNCAGGTRRGWRPRAGARLSRRDLRSAGRAAFVSGDGLLEADQDLIGDQLMVLSDTHTA